MFRKLKMTLAMTLASVLASLGLTASPALAAWSDCNAGYLCIFDGTSGSGLVYQWTVGYIKTLANDCLTLSGSQNNMASSVYYNGSLAGGNIIMLFDVSISRGPYRVIQTNGYQDSNLGATPGITGFSNVISQICIR